MAYVATSASYPDFNPINYYTYPTGSTSTIAPAQSVSSLEATGDISAGGNLSIAGTSTQTGLITAAGGITTSSIQTSFEKHWSSTEFGTGTGLYKVADYSWSSSDTDNKGAASILVTGVIGARKTPAKFTFVLNCGTANTAPDPILGQIESKLAYVATNLDFVVYYNAVTAKTSIVLKTSAVDRFFDFTVAGANGVFTTLYSLGTAFSATADETVKTASVLGSLKTIVGSTFTYPQLSCTNISTAYSKHWNHHELFGDEFLGNAPSLGLSHQNLARINPIGSLTPITVFGSFGSYKHESGLMNFEFTIDFNYSPSPVLTNMKLYGTGQTYALACCDFELLSADGYYYLQFICFGKFTFDFTVLTAQDNGNITFYEPSTYRFGHTNGPTSMWRRILTNGSGTIDTGTAIQTRVNVAGGESTYLLSQQTKATKVTWVPSLDVTNTTTTTATVTVRDTAPTSTASVALTPGYLSIDKNYAANTETAMLTSTGHVSDAAKIDKLDLKYTTTGAGTVSTNSHKIAHTYDSTNYQNLNFTGTTDISFSSGTNSALISANCSSGLLTVDQLTTSSRKYWNFSSPLLFGSWGGTIPTLEDIVAGKSARLKLCTAQLGLGHVKISGVLYELDGDGYRTASFDTFTSFYLSATSEPVTTGIVTFSQTPASFQKVALYLTQDPSTYLTTIYLQIQTRSGYFDARFDFVIETSSSSVTLFPATLENYSTDGVPNVKYNLLSQVSTKNYTAQNINTVSNKCFQKTNTSALTDLFFNSFTRANTNPTDFVKYSQQLSDGLDNLTIGTIKGATNAKSDDIAYIKKSSGSAVLQSIHFGPGETNITMSKGSNATPQITFDTSNGDITSLGTITSAIQNYTTLTCNELHSYYYSGNVASNEYLSSVALNFTDYMYLTFIFGSGGTGANQSVTCSCCWVRNGSPNVGEVYHFVTSPNSVIAITIPVSGADEQKIKVQNTNGAGGQFISMSILGVKIQKTGS